MEFPYGRPPVVSLYVSSSFRKGTTTAKTDSRLRLSGMTTLLKRGHSELVSESTACVVSRCVILESRSPGSVIIK